MLLGVSSPTEHLFYIRKMDKIGQHSHKYKNAKLQKSDRQNDNEKRALLSLKNFMKKYQKVIIYV